MRFYLLALTALVVTIPCAAIAQDRGRAIDDTLELHYVGHAIGHETYSLRPNDDG